MNRKKLSILLCIALCLTLLPAPAMAENADDSAGGSEPITEINSLQDLENFAASVNAGTDYSGVTVTLTTSVSMTDEYSMYDLTDTWTAIGTSDHPFNGTFDGGEKTINVYIVAEWGTDADVGLFGYVGRGGVVKNLEVKGIVMNNASAYVGGIAGNNAGTIENCHMAEGATTGNNGHTGGIVGYNMGTVTGCENHAEISSNGSNNGVIGGIVGENGNNGTVENCYNEGKVRTGVSSAGGVVGENNGGIVDNCYNDGEVFGDGYDDLNIPKNHMDSRNIGGIVGENNGGEVNGCTNTFAVTGELNVGGVVGYNKDTVTGCTNSGDVSGDSHVGGIVGENDSGTVTGCANSGDVSGDSHVGGVVGYNSSGTVENCYNTGDASCGDDDYVGGVVGYNSSGTVENCYNTGDASGGDNAHVGGVVGYHDSGTAENCYYLNGTADGGIDGADDQDKAEGKDEAVFKSGEVAWLLQDGQENESPLVWGQTIGTHARPLLVSSVTGKDAQKVFRVQLVVENEAETPWKTEYTNGGNYKPGEPDGEAGKVIAWYNENTYVSLWNQTVTADTMLYGRWETAYSITVESTVNGTVKADKKKTFEGDTVTLTVTSDADYELGTLTVKDKDGKDVTVSADNTFTMPASDVTVSAKFVQVIQIDDDDRLVVDDITELPKNPEDRKDLDKIGDETISDVEALKNWMYRALSEALASGLTLGEDNYKLFDVTFQRKADGGVWEDVTEDNFPKEGITVTMPYTLFAGTDSTYTFKVLHIFTGSAKFGEYEFPTVTKTNTGIQFTVYSLSPVGVAWKVSSETTDTPKPGGGDTSSSAPTYPPVIKDTEHGTVEVSPKTPERGDDVTITTIPDPGYETGSVKARGKSGKDVAVKDNGDGTYSFTQPSEIVTIEVEFVPLNGAPGHEDCPSLAYDDLDISLWYHPYTDYVIANELMIGYGDDIFGPNDTLSRAMLAQIIYNMEGRPGVTGDSPFTDVTPGAWYAGAVTWAQTNSVVEGYGNGLYGSEDPITREQLAAMLYRYAGEQKTDGGLSAFTDAGEVSDWAADAMAWAVANGIVEGKGDGILGPKGNATRVEAAAMLTRFCKII